LISCLVTITTQPLYNQDYWFWFGAWKAPMSRLVLNHVLLQHLALPILLSSSVGTSPYSNDQVLGASSLLGWLKANTQHYCAARRCLGNQEVLMVAKRHYDGVRSAYIQQLGTGKTRPVIVEPNLAHRYFLETPDDYSPGMCLAGT